MERKGLRVEERGATPSVHVHLIHEGAGPTQFCKAAYSESVFDSNSVPLFVPDCMTRRHSALTG